jgi:hypothetical protein
MHAGKPVPPTAIVLVEAGVVRLVPGVTMFVLLHVGLLVKTSACQIVRQDVELLVPEPVVLDVLLDVVVVPAAVVVVLVDVAEDVLVDVVLDAKVDVTEIVLTAVLKVVQVFVVLVVLLDVEHVLVVGRIVV